MLSLLESVRRLQLHAPGPFGFGGPRRVTVNRLSSKYEVNLLNAHGELPKALTAPSTHFSVRIIDIPDRASQGGQFPGYARRPGVQRVAESSLYHTARIAESRSLKADMSPSPLMGETSSETNLAGSNANSKSCIFSGPSGTDLLERHT